MNDIKTRLLKIVSGAIIFGTGIIFSFFFTEIFSEIIPLFFLSAYIILGANILWRAMKNIFVNKNPGGILDENFLMSLATIGALFIGEYSEAAAVMFFYQLGELFQEMAVNKSKKSIKALLDIRPDYANLKKNGEIIKTNPEKIRVGDLIIVKAGEKIPLDGIIIEGEATLDTKTITGEPIPRSAKVSDNAFSGCINLNGLLVIKVTKTFEQSTVSKIVELVENASRKKAPTENFISIFARYYTPVVVIAAAFIAILPPVFGFGEWTDWLHRSLVFLVISCPCALVISIPLGFFGGIGGASRMGVMVKGGNFLEALNSLEIAVFDKTGTLTKGVFSLSSIQSADGWTCQQTLEYAARAELLSNHPIAISIRSAYGKDIDNTGLSEFCEISGQGISVKWYGKTILAGNKKLMYANNISFRENSGVGTKIYITFDNDFIGSIIISDALKPDSKAAIAALKSLGVKKTIMLSGDNPEITAGVAAELGIDENYGGLLPHEKIGKIELFLKQKRKNGKLAFIGDGINDAPALARADIGIAMGGLGSDAAIEAADVVLMTDEPSKLLGVIKIARFTKRIVWQNIIIALGIKGVFLTLGVFGIASMWEAVFADVGVALFAILNATRVINASQDRFLSDQALKL